MRQHLFFLFLSILCIGAMETAAKVERVDSKLSVSKTVTPHNNRHGLSLGLGLRHFSDLIDVSAMPVGYLNWSLQHTPRNNYYLGIQSSLGARPLDNEQTLFLFSSDGDEAGSITDASFFSFYFGTEYRLKKSPLYFLLGAELFRFYEDTTSVSGYGIHLGIGYVHDIAPHLQVRSRLGIEYLNASSASIDGRSGRLSGMSGVSPSLGSELRWLL